MGLERVLARLGRVFIVLLLLTIAYVAASIVIALVWQVGASDWPFFILMGSTFAVVAVYLVTLIALRADKRDLVATLSAEARAWSDSQTARAAAMAGDHLTRVEGFRANARAPHVVEIRWNPTLDAVDEVHVYRSLTGFATAPDPGDDQELISREVETAHIETDLDDERVYFYTAFARGRDGRWSSPSWTWAATPRLPLHTKLLSALRLARFGTFDGPA